METASRPAALVTGAASGMGRATAWAFASAGYRVVLADINADAGGEAADEITSRGLEAHFVRADVTKSDEVENMVAAATDRYGRLDCAVNNAACPPDRERIVDADVESFREVVEINLTSVLVCLKYELAQMLGRGGPGSIVNIGSIRSFRAGAGSPAYTAAKHAIIGLTRTAALECSGTGVRVNAVCPGAIDTPMLRQSRSTRAEGAVAAHLGTLGRLGTPDEVAQASLWLCSSASSLVTGQALVADGGYLIQ
ncbi:SDR family NAD(P)-dependent oxidoreductase [Saccharopolyspora mangrovi]|uniref:SDR family oxidoreductase n=1 Tax=Saccharopolyspora mangrovi TaxID=3082379 RepID=A0ABU6A4D7_9PSEU|nr:SDR family oxidoreductase [Saccharopolyspora sp. S2-29]MEB3366431.1 SDR family oxidoreductase [Saccharopolyspora sp. S2-29]